MTKTEVAGVVKKVAAVSRPWRFAEGCERAPFLEAVATALQARREEIIRTACEETSLTAEELAPEFARMTRTFSMLAKALREGSWVRAAIDAPCDDAAASIGPNHDVRRMLQALPGVVAVFGASNFPLSYGACGGDTASALAAGCGVVVKEHPAHPRTGRLVHSIASTAFADRLAGLMGYVHNEDPRDFAVAQELIADPAVVGVGFTGSVRGGLAIEALCRARPAGLPTIPAFCEMGSVNPVFVSEASAEVRGVEIAVTLAESILARYGQQCTCPGLLFLPERGSAAMTARLTDLFAVARGREMLSIGVRDAYMRRLDELRAVPGVEVLATGGCVNSPRSAPAMLLRAPSNVYLANRTLHEEVFGPAAIIVEFNHLGDWGKLALVESLAVSFFDEVRTPIHPHDFLATNFAQYDLLPCAGRMIFNGIPTGVRVAHGMVHSGPFPACNRPDTTAVGPFAMERWCRQVCYQNCPQELLPPELRDDNPLGITRHVDGVVVIGKGK